MNAHSVRGERRFSIARAARIVLIGPPGVGKGTQGERLMRRFPQLSAISSGDLLRRNVRERTPLGIRAESIMNAGALVPDSLMIRLILGELRSRRWITGSTTPLTLSAMTAAPSGAGAGEDHADSFATGLDDAGVERLQASDDPSASFILDGFPRTARQAAQLDSQVGINLAVHIITPISIILDRVCHRWVHVPSGRVYNDTFNPPRIAGRDDLTGDILTRRPDDDPETWTRRLKKFDDTSRPLLEHYRRKKVLWTVEGNSSDEISPLLFAEFERRFVALSS
ncbi:MAG: hypothetical protein M1826_007659 [Phylliscum demangeonii]|nr:MAG: hypothetical protein M1826_007659 [Phylliscum demangeonii]